MRLLSVLMLLAAFVFPSGYASASPPINLSAEELQTLQTQAAQGDAKAQFFLGILYYNGQGVPQDYGKARQWYEQAAAQGHAGAQNILAELYYAGLGVQQDDVRAYMWFSLAVARSTGNKQKSTAIQRDGALTRRMTPAQVAEAQRLAQQCEAQGLKGC